MVVEEEKELTVDPQTFEGSLKRLKEALVEEWQGGGCWVKLARLADEEARVEVVRATRSWS